MITTILNAVCLVITLIVVLLGVRMRKEVEQMRVVTHYLDVLDIMLSDMSNIDMEDIMLWKEEVDDALESL